MALATFVLDTITALEIAIAVFYVAVILLSATIWQRQGVVLVSAGCILLALLSHMVSLKSATDAGVINLIISLSAIVTTT